MSTTVVRAAWTAAACVGAAALVYVLMVLTPAGQALDDVGLLGQKVQTQAWLDRARTLLSFLSVTTIAIQLLALCVVGWARRGWRAGLFVGTCLGVSIVGAEVLKHFVLPRPDLVEAFDEKGFNTLPSGHTTIAATIALGLVLVVPVRWRPPATFLAALGAALVGAATLEAGWHRASDAVAALWWTAAVFLAALAVGLRRGWIAASGQRVRGGPFVWLTVAVGAVFTVGTILMLPTGVTRALEVARDGPSVVTPDDLDASFTLGWWAVVASGVAVAVLWWRMLGDIELTEGRPAMAAAERGSTQGEADETPEQAARRRARAALDAVDLVPEQTRDDRAEPGSADDAVARLERERPPHHGG